MPAAYEMAELNFKKIKPGTWRKFIYSLGNALLYSPIKKDLGLKNAKICYSTEAVLSPEASRFYHALGLPLKSVYATTEAGVLAGAYNDDIRIDSVGRTHEGIEIKITEEGELICRQPGIFLGYYKNEQATQEGYTSDGFLRTGDAGYFGEDGHLYVFDRAKDIMTLNDGTRFAPQDIETRLKFSAYINEAMVCGGDRPYVTAIVSIDLENVGNWAKKRNISFTTFQDLSQRSEVYQLVQSEIHKINERFPENIRIKRFAILLKQLHPDDGELTRTRKVRRKFVNERYHALIEDLYNSADLHELDLEIRYEDGHKSAFKGRIAIEEST